MGARIGASQKMASRIETGERLPTRAMLDAWLADADEDVRDRVRVMADAAHVETRPWGSLREGGHLQSAATAEEEVATRGRIYCGVFLPGLLQTAAYTRLLIPLVDPVSDPASSAAARARRAERLYDVDRHFDFLIGEPALLWAPASEVMPAQMDRLVSVATLPNVELAVLPARHRGQVSWHDFTIWDAPELPPWVSVEMRHGAAVIADPDAVADYERLWGELWSAAARGDEAISIIRDRADTATRDRDL